MSYRDELEAARHRIQVLEEQVAHQNDSSASEALNDVGLPELPETHAAEAADVSGVGYVDTLLEGLATFVASEWRGYPRWLLALGPLTLGAIALVPFLKLNENELSAAVIILLSNVLMTTCLLLERALRKKAGKQEGAGRLLLILACLVGAPAWMWAVIFLLPPFGIVLGLSFGFAALLEWVRGR
jgi:hypothetical protein